jgi:hypothetical protein
MGHDKKWPCCLLLDSGQSDRVADGKPQGAKLALPGVVWQSSRALAQLAGSNVRKEASATLWQMFNAPLHGYSPGSFEQYQGTQGCLEKK